VKSAQPARPGRGQRQRQPDTLGDAPALRSRALRFHEVRLLAAGAPQHVTRQRSRDLFSSEPPRPWRRRLVVVYAAVGGVGGLIAARAGSAKKRLRSKASVAP